MVTNTAPGLDLESSFEQALQGFGLSPGAAHLLWLPLPMVLVLVAAVVGVLVNVWLERKISAAVQQRIGPEYAGALGVLQPIADGLKLVFKEDIIPAKADGLLFTLGPVLVLIPVILSWLVVPFGQHLLISNVGIGIFLWISLSSIQPIGLLMSGYASNNKYSLLGGLRAAAQSISYEIPLALAVLAVVIFRFTWDPTAIPALDLAPGVLWVIFTFSGLLGLNRSFGLELAERAYDGLLASQVSREAIFTGKVIANLVFVMCVQALALPAVALFFDVSFGTSWWIIVGIVMLASIGLSAVGTLFAAIDSNTRLAELLLPMMTLPFFVPLVIS